MFKIQSKMIKIQNERQRLLFYFFICIYSFKLYTLF